MATVELTVNNRIGLITFNRPEAHNALNKEMLQAFMKIIREVLAQNVGIIVMTGAGDKAFIAGADIKEMQMMPPLQAGDFSGLGQGSLGLMDKLPIISIAAVNGIALGGGCEFAMACDLIYAADTAKFGQPEVNLGVIPGFGGTQRLPRLVGLMKAREMIYTGGPIDAQEAYRIGLVAGVFPQATLMAEVMKIAEKVLGKSPEAIKRAKQAMRDGFSEDLAKAVGIEKEQFASCFAHGNQREGMTAFLEKRKPNWSVGKPAPAPKPEPEPKSETK